jgi:hypothetical protein
MSPALQFQEGHFIIYKRIWTAAHFMVALTSYNAHDCNGVDFPPSLKSMTIIEMRWPYNLPIYNLPCHVDELSCWRVVCWRNISWRIVNLRNVWAQQILSYGLLLISKKFTYKGGCEVSKKNKKKNIWCCLCYDFIIFMLS